MDRWGRITGTPLILPPAKAKQGAVAGYPRRMPQTARALAFTPAASGAQSSDAALQTAAQGAAGVTAPTSPETSMRKVLHSGNWEMAAVGESRAAPAAPVHQKAKDHEVQTRFWHSSSLSQCQICAVWPSARLARRNASLPSTMTVALVSRARRGRSGGTEHIGSFNANAGCCAIVRANRYEMWAGAAGRALSSSYSRRCGARDS